MGWPIRWTSAATKVNARGSCSVMCAEIDVVHNVLDPRYRRCCQRLPQDCDQQQFGHAVVQEHLAMTPRIGVEFGARGAKRLSSARLPI